MWCLSKAALTNLMKRGMRKKWILAAKSLRTQAGLLVGWMGKDKAVDKRWGVAMHLDIRLTKSRESVTKFYGGWVVAKFLLE